MSGTEYKCPECGEPRLDIDPVAEQYTCHHCGFTAPINAAPFELVKRQGARGSNRAKCPGCLKVLPLSPTTGLCNSCHNTRRIKGWTTQQLIKYKADRRNRWAK